MHAHRAGGSGPAADCLSGRPDATVRRRCCDGAATGDIRTRYTWTDKMLVVRLTDSGTAAAQPAVPAPGNPKATSLARSVAGAELGAPRHRG